jgi:hypothetical protein
LVDLFLLFYDTLPVLIPRFDRFTLAIQTGISFRANYTTGSAVIGVITDSNTFTVAIYLTSRAFLEEA